LYFEGQNRKDCTLHSVNNAFGREVATKADVLLLIDKKATDLHDALLAKGEPQESVDKAVKKLRNRYSDDKGKTFFAADIVWETVKGKGAYGLHLPIPGFSSPYLKMDLLTPEILQRPIVVLGGNPGGGTHAIAIRGGRIYDSEFSALGPQELTKKNLSHSLPKVFAAYVFLNDKSEAPIVKRAAASRGWYSMEN